MRQPGPKITKKTIHDIMSKRDTVGVEKEQTQRNASIKVTSKKLNCSAMSYDRTATKAHFE